MWHYFFLLDFGTVSDSVNIICFSMGLWNYSHSVALSVYLLYFGTDQTVWRDFFFYGTLELYWQWAIICCSIVLWNSSDSVSIICFSMGLWNYSHSVALSVYLLDIGTDQRVWHYLFFYGTFELFWQCAIICVSIRIWNCCDIVALFVFIWDFGTVLTVWHYLFLYHQIDL